MEPVTHYKRQERGLEDKKGWEAERPDEDDEQPPPVHECGDSKRGQRTHHCEVDSQVVVPEFGERVRGRGQHDVMLSTVRREGWGRERWEWTKRRKGEGWGMMDKS